MNRNYYHKRKNKEKGVNNINETGSIRPAKKSQDNIKGNCPEQKVNEQFPVIKINVRHQ
jgi:hypothetical protein